MRPESTVTFYFTSGQKMTVSYTKKELKELFWDLTKGWPEKPIINGSFGVNFNHVTHYKVNEEED